MKRCAPHVALALVLLLSMHPAAAAAQELALQYGTTQVEKGEGRDRSWQIDFRYRFATNFAASAAYLNEGHVPGHKRDGLAAQLWGSVPLFRRAVALDFGAGIYRYSDTQPRPAGSYADVNDWAGIYSASATYYLRSPWFFRFTANRVNPPHDVDTNTYGLGVGYRLWNAPAEPCPLPPESACKPPSRTTGDEAMLFAGQSVVNSFADQKGIAAGVEFRKGIADHVDASLSWIYEGDQDVIRRNGVAGELWLVDLYMDRRLALGIGGGGYAFIDTRNPNGTRGGNPGDLGGILSLTAGWRFADRWITRFNWHRVVSGNNRDTDIFVGGVGYRWEE
ncbi:MAG TPA: outer membrane beta-barrel protein [Candidatus Deferrimicrobiaceae bacterium]|jgi:hypothetical protein